MTIGKASALTLGLLGTFALGVAVGPGDDGPHGRRSRRLGANSTDVAAACAGTEPSRARGDPREVDGVARVPCHAESSSPIGLARASSMVPASQPELQARLKPVLNRGAKMALASEGFRDAEQFAAVAHAARNTEIPFMVLKHRVLNEGQSLEDAIRAFKPDLNANAEARRARAEAQADVAGLGN